MLEHRQLQNVCTLLTARSKNEWNALTCHVRWLIGISEGLRSKKSLLGKVLLLVRWQQATTSMQLALRDIVSPEQIYQQVRQLETRYKVELGDEPLPYIRVNLGTVYLLDKFNMGEFAVDFTIGESGRVITRVVHTGQLGPRMTEKEPHPHVAGHAFCAGASDYTFSTLLETGELVEYVTLLEQLLHTYNPNEAYRTLWDEICPQCGEYCALDDILPCQNCIDYVCGHCGLRTCANCQVEICPNCTTFCYLCGKAICTVCLTAWCTTCRNNLCDECAGKCTRVGANEYVCTECDRIKQC